MARPKQQTEWEESERSLTGCFEALAGEPSVSASEIDEIRSRMPPIDRDRLQRAPESVRGELDHYALKLRFHDPLIHQRMMPASAAAAAVFDALERTRFEALGMQQYRGVVPTIDAMDAETHSKLTTEALSGNDTAGHLPEALRLLLREKIPGLRVPTVAEGFVSPWRKHLEAALSHWKGDLSLLESQTDFARWAADVLSEMEMTSEASESDEQQAEQTEEDQPDEQSDHSQQDESPDDSSQPQPPLEAGADDESVPMEGESEVSEEGGHFQGEDFAYRPPSPEGIEHGAYTVFSPRYDEQIHAGDLASTSELKDLRQELDRKVAGVNQIISRLANRLQRRLMAQQNRSWQFDLEQGILDPARLARVVIDPQQPLSFKQEKESAFKDTVVTLLIDNSGSMRGRPISIAAISVDILARTLERCGVACEILGFTTRCWRGGRVKDEWIAAGRPAQPGRLSGLGHIIYKFADTPYRRVRDHLGLMLQEGLLKENIDGEALLWAYQRLTSRQEKRRIMIVISDGAPVDDATLSANNVMILEEHLRTIIAQIEQRDEVELLAIGIGHDVTRYYKHSVMMNNIDQLGPVLLDELGKLLTVRSGRQA